tara:strand:+ start:992 stop:2176 length:1185 start_codon:yes stop_codon:yes gene_type:complete
MSEEKEVIKEGEFKVKKRPSMKKLVKEDEVIKVDLSAPKAEEPEVTKVVIPSIEENKDTVNEQTETVEQPTADVPSDRSDNEKQEEKVEDTISVIQEITEEEVEEKTQEVIEAVQELKETGKPLPENIEKLVSFMEDTGGNIEDYVRLNADYSNVDGNTLLREYYSKSKPHLDEAEISFLLEDNFKFDEEYDDEKEVRRKKLAFKEEVAKASGFLDDLKGKYYDDIKLRPGVTQEQKKADDFFNRHKEQEELLKGKRDRFKKATSNLLNDDFKGFDFNIGEKKFRYGINNPTKVAEDQSNISDFIGKFLDDKEEVSDHKGYHKAMYAASNVDKIATHFYEQGKADAVKEVVDSSKNITSKPRQTASDSVFINGLKVKSITGMDSSKLRIKKKQF